MAAANLGKEGNTGSGSSNEETLYTTSEAHGSRGRGGRASSSRRGA